MVRQPAVSGYFYPSRASEIRAMMQAMLTEETKLALAKKLERVKDVSGVVSPHAGYVYSGRVAAYSFYTLSLFPPVETVVLIGPNHRGIGEKVALAGEDFWQTPLGLVAIDKEAVTFLADHAPIFRIDSGAHRLEHSLEVQVPFLQHFLLYDFRIVPIALAKQDALTARAIAEALVTLGRKRRIVVVASSDFSHYEQARVVTEKDTALIAHILSLDVDGFYQEIVLRNISVCGPGGIATLMEYHRMLSGQTPSLLLYTHSGEVTGEQNEVVGYASIVFPLSFS